MGKILLPDLKFLFGYNNEDSNSIADILKFMILTVYTLFNFQ